MGCRGRSSVRGKSSAGGKSYLSTMGSEIMKKLTDSVSRLSGEGAFEILAKANALEREGRSIVHMEIGQPDFPTPENVKEAGIRAIRENKTRYTPSNGIYELREAIAERIEQTRGFRPSHEQILPTVGGKGVIFYSILALVEPGDEVILPNPGYPAYASVVNYVGGKIVDLPLLEEARFEIDIADVEERITDRTKLIIINSPHNPCGSVLSKRCIEDIASLCEQRDIYLLSDEIYSKVIYDQEHHSPGVADECRERTLLLDGFSKTYSMTGWRLCYCIGPTPVIKQMSVLLLNSVSCVPSMVQWAGVEALRGPQDKVGEMVRIFKERRDLIVSGLNSISNVECHLPGGAFYAFPSIKKTGMTSKALQEYLLTEAGVALLPGTGFGRYGEGYLRLSYATSKEQIMEGLRRIKDGIDRL